MEDIKIRDILNNHITPFEITDEKLKTLFSFYLHLAPTIKSGSAIDLDASRYQKIWDEFITLIKLEESGYHIYTQGNIENKPLTKYSLEDAARVKRNRKGFICCYKDKDESSLECILRHIRNSVAHSNVYVLDRRRKFILFEDYNTSKKHSARMLFSQTDLQLLKKLLIREAKRKREKA